MAYLVIDAMDNANFWRAYAPDGVTPSTELSMTNDSTHVRFGADRKSGCITASSNALHHVLQHSLAALDLTSFDEIRLWLWSSRGADGSEAQPFFLEVRLASATMSIQDPANTWSRYLSASQAETWELVRLSLDGLQTAVREAVNLIQLRCVNTTVAFTCYIDDVLAVREEMIGDVDAALLELLHQQVRVDGALIPAFFIHPENPPEELIPSIRIMQYDIQYDSSRTSVVRSRSDFTTSGFRLRPTSIAYDLYYAVDVYAHSRQQKTQVMEFVLRTLSPCSALFVNGVQIRLEWITISPLDETGKWRSDRELLYFKVATRQENGPAEWVTPPYRDVSIGLDQKIQP